MSVDQFVLFLLFCATACARDGRLPWVGKLVEKQGSPSYFVTGFRNGRMVFSLVPSQWFVTVEKAGCRETFAVERGFFDAAKINETVAIKE